MNVGFLESVSHSFPLSLSLVCQERDVFLFCFFHFTGKSHIRMLVIKVGQKLLDVWLLSKQEENVVYVSFIENCLKTCRAIL